MRPVVIGAGVPHARRRPEEVPREADRSERRVGVRDGAHRRNPLAGGGLSGNPGRVHGGRGDHVLAGGRGVAVPVLLLG